MTYFKTNYLGTSPTELRIVLLLREYIYGVRPLGVASNGTYRYLTPEGNRCIIGNFFPATISPEKALTIYWGVSYLVAHNPIEGISFTYLTKHCSSNFLKRAQEVHDGYDPEAFNQQTFLVSSTLKRLRKFAKTEQARKEITALILELKQKQEYSKKKGK
jgi:hypothetical protein